MVDNTELTPDERAFLARTGAIDRINKPDPSHAIADHKPAWPKKTLITVGVLYIISLLVILAILQTMRPYSEVLNTDTFTTILNEAAKDPSLNADIGADQMGSLKTLYSYQWVFYLIDTVIFGVISGIIALIHVIKSNRWETLHAKKQADNS